MTKVLKVILNLPDSKTTTYSLQDPKNDLTKAEVETLFNDMITKSFIEVNSVEPTGVKRAYIYETNQIDLE